MAILFLGFSNNENVSIILSNFIGTKINILLKYLLSKLFFDSEYQGLSFYIIKVKNTTMLKPFEVHRV